LNDFDKKAVDNMIIYNIGADKVTIGMIVDKMNIVKMTVDKMTRKNDCRKNDCRQND
jgi:hypothetical protein